MKKLLHPQYPAPALNLSDSPLFLPVPGSDADSDNIHAVFRRKFFFDGNRKAMFHIAVHGHYFFHINDFYGLGPVRSTDSRIFADSYDLSAALQPGENTIFVELHYPGSSYRTVPASIPGVWAEIENVPDSPWEYAKDIRHKKSFEYTFQLGKCENRDDRTKELQFYPVQEIRNPNGTVLSSRPIPPLTNEEYPFTKVCKCGFLPEFSPDDDDFARRMAEEVQVTAPEAFTDNTFAPPPAGFHGTFAIFDLGREFYGKVEIELETDESVIVDRSYDELLSFSRVKSCYAFGKWIPRARHAGDGYRFADRRITMPGKSCISVNFSDRGGRFLEVALRNHTKAVKITRIAAIDRIYPVPFSNIVSSAV